MIEPFCILSLRQAPPRTLTLDYTGTIPGWLPIRTLLNKHYLVSLAGFGAILTELLIVCVSSFNVNGRSLAASTSALPFVATADAPYNTTETFQSFWASLSLSSASSCSSLSSHP